MNERLVFGSPVDGLLDRLYARNVAQNDAVADYFTARAADGSLDWNQFDERTNEFLKDKLIALDRVSMNVRRLRFQLCRPGGTGFATQTRRNAAPRALCCPSQP